MHSDLKIEVAQRRMPRQMMFSGGITETFGAASNMPAGFHVNAGQSVVLYSGNTTAGTEYSIFAGPTLVMGTSDPVISGTKIAIYRISALLDGGMSVKQVMEDFPSLSADQIIQARDFAHMYPNHGKQYPKKSLKRFLRSSSFSRIKKELAEIRGARSVSAR